LQHFCFALPFEFHSDLERCVSKDLPGDNGSGGGYLIWTQTTMFTNLPGEDGEMKYFDMDGKAWEAKTQGIFIGELVRDKDGPHRFKCAFVQGFANLTQLLGVAVRKVVLPVEVLAGEVA